MKRHEWRPATVVTAGRAASDMVALRVQPHEWIPHLAGQHYEIRFPAERLSRKFSIASAPEAVSALEFGVQVRPRGMLTPRLALCAPGDRIEVRGPTGQAFAWEPSDGGPLLLLGAGAGVTPVLSIHAAYIASGLRSTVCFALSVSAADRIYRREVLPVDARIRITGRDGRIDRCFLEELLRPLPARDEVRVRICGPLGFMDAMVDQLLDIGVSEELIRSEAFV